MEKIIKIIMIFIWLMPNYAGLKGQCNPETDSLALVALYNATNGPGWTNNTHWLTGPVSTWYNVSTDGGGCVTGLDLSSNQLTGSIPPELGNLLYLDYLDLSYNQLTGSIPPELGNLVNLGILALRTNQLTGSIPPQLGNLLDLNYLDLINNQLTGSIPPELGNLLNLNDLYLSYNQLTGSIPPELGNLLNLGSLNLSINQLTGSIPPELGNLLDLNYLYLSNNQLTGSIPPELGNLLDLGILDLSHNQLTGSIPPELGNLLDLYYLILINNQLTGSLPPELGNLLDLGILDLSHNQLTGSLPPELGNLVNLVGLVLSYNQLTGSIPPELGNLLNLNDLDLSTNQLTGSIPPELGNLLNVGSLDLSYNQLTGCFLEELDVFCSAFFYNFSNNPALPWGGDFGLFCAGIDQIGAPCDDNNANTTNDVYNASCVCAGTLLPTCTDGIMNGTETGVDCGGSCPACPTDCDPNTAGIQSPDSSCDDSDACTTNDVYNESCVCDGTFQDIDGDGTCDADDNCPSIEGVQGDPCDDGNANTSGDVIIENCICQGILTGIDDAHQGDGYIFKISDGKYYLGNNSKTIEIIYVYDITGKSLQFERNGDVLYIHNSPPGIKFVRIVGDQVTDCIKIE